MNGDFSARRAGAPVRRGLVTVAAIVLTCAAPAPATARTVGARDADQIASRNVSQDAGWTSVSIGYGHVCASKDDGSLWCWGSDFYGDLGNGPGGGTILRPEQIGLEHTWTAAAVGGEHSCAIAKNHSLWCWGANFWGDLGDGTMHARSRPTKVEGGFRWTSVALGYAFTCGIQTDGTLWCWGGNIEGQLGDGTVQPHKLPAQVGTATDWVAVSAGYESTCGIRADATLWCWGYNYDGQLGDGTRNTRLSPVQIGSDRAWASVDISNGFYGDPHTCAVAVEGTLWCWGSANYGVLGNGAVEDQLLPAQVGTRTDWAVAAVADRNSCSTRTTGTGWCWGNNHSGQLGNGTTHNSPRPVQVGPPKTWVSIEPGESSACGIRPEHSLWCWGTGLLGNGEYNTTHTLPVRVK